MENACETAHWQVPELFPFMAWLQSVLKGGASRIEKEVGGFQFP